VNTERDFAISCCGIRGDRCCQTSHYVFLLGIKNLDERRFYEIEATSQSWALRELKRQFNSGLYERLALSRDKAGIRKLAKGGQIVSQPRNLLKEPLYQLYLPNKVELRKKLEEWAGEA
jgi:predicted nuclease of restriction endonuclease-like (RecB) superfamily